MDYSEMTKFGQNNISGDRRTWPIVPSLDQWEKQTFTGIGFENRGYLDLVYVYGPYQIIHEEEWYGNNTHGWNCVLEIDSDSKYPIIEMPVVKAGTISEAISTLGNYVENQKQRAIAEYGHDKENILQLPISADEIFILQDALDSYEDKIFEHNQIVGKNDNPEKLELLTGLMAKLVNVQFVSEPSLDSEAKDMSAAKDAQDVPAAGHDKDKGAL